MKIKKINGAIPYKKSYKNMYFVDQHKGAQGVPRNGLIGEYLFVSNALDTSGQSNNGTPNAVTYVADRKGNPASAASFNGSSSYVQVIGNPFYFPNNQPYSFSFWYKLASGQSANDYMFFSGRNTVGGINYVIGYKSSSDDITIGVNDSAGTLGSTAYPPVPDRDTWHHLAFTFDGSEMIAYRDSIQIDSDLGSTGTVSSDSDKFFMGRDNFGGNDFLGVLDDVRIYNRELLLSEITTLFNE